jgi:hypothetical protein
MCQYIYKCSFIRDQPTQALIDTGEGYHLGAPNMKTDLSPTVPSGILHIS